MVNWQVTATTIYCDAVDDDVTIMVYKDGSTICTAYDKFYKPSNEIRKLLEKKGKRLGRRLECEGNECHLVIQYKDKLFAD